ncbi:MAG: polysaccharide biosynthesis tyrosine autokinase [Elusimicrobia bacterium]|nr:polysaccharide biosynthesis tyrosine autokinase [Candidatus Obscuribacterium magneticum]
MEPYIPQSVDEYIDIFLKRKKLFFAPFVSILMLTLIVYPFLPKKYESSALIMIEELTLLNPLVRGIAVENEPIDTKLRTISAQILNWASMVELTRKMNLAEEITDQKEYEKLITKMKSKILIRPVAQDIVRISYEDKDKYMAMNVTNLVSENLVDKNKQIRQKQAVEAIDFIHDQLNIYKDKLQNSEKSFFTNRVNSELNEAIKRKILLQDQLSQVEKTIVREVVRDQSPAIAGMRRELAQLESELIQMTQSATKENPLVLEYKKRIEILKRRIKMEETSSAGSETSAMNPVYQDLNRQVKELELQISSLEKKKADLQSGKIEVKNVSDQELLAMERDKRVNEDIYQTLLTRLENAQISQKMGDSTQGGTFKIIDPARLPLKPSSPNPLKVFPAGFLLAVFAGFAAVFLREYFDSSFRGISDAKKYFDIPLLAYIPKIVTQANESASGMLNLKEISRNGKNNSWIMTLIKKFHEPLKVDITYKAEKIKDPAVSPYIVCFHDPESMPAEQYRLFQTHLLFLNKEKPVKTLLVTSAVASEGKTSAATNIAVSLAMELNRKILLIDCDLRRGTVAKNLGLEPENGLIDFLSGECQLDSILKNTKVDRLTAITSGAPCASPTRYLVMDKMDNLMRALREQFDFIIIDAPPVLDLSDVPVLAPYADGAVLVVQAGGTQRESAKAAKETLQTGNNVNVIGFILTQVESYMPSYMYRYLVRPGAETIQK